MRLVTAAGGVVFAAHHVVGFSVRPLDATSIAPRQSALFQQRQTAATSAGSLSPLLNSDGRECPACSRTSRRRPWWNTARRNSSGTVVSMLTMPAATAAGTPMVVSEDHEPSRPAVLRMAIVGENADELGLRIAERYGLVVASMDGLMTGRKGRKTDSVKAKAAAEWFTEEGDATVGEGRNDWRAGRVLTGFPTTATQAELLEKQGVDLEQLVLVTRAGEVPRKAGEENDSVNANEEEEQRLLTERLAGRVVKLAGQQDVDSFCDSATSLLAIGGEQSARVAKSSPQRPLPPPPSTMLSDTDMWMSPSEHAATHAEATELGAVGPEADRRARSRAGAEAKKAKKEAIRQKKRIANEAQQLDTPFYAVVATGGPKARFRAPVPMVPSRITERLSSAVSPGGGEKDTSSNTRLEFGSLELNSPASDCLLAAGITEPTGIQKAGMGPILNGESVILHAMTGSGKTLTFLLPLMQRWTPGLFYPEAAKAGAKTGKRSRRGDAGAGPAPWQVLLALPTRELAVQVAREVVLLSGGLTASVELLVDASVLHDLSKVTAPIVVGSAKVLERLIRKSHPTVRNDVLPRIKCIVVDEVDRLVDVLSKHAPAKEAEKRKKHARPIEALLERVLSANGEAQVVACSATIGRPLRRELGHIVRRASSIGTLPSAAGYGSGGAENEAGGSNRRHELRVIRDALTESMGRSLATERAVVIPNTIRHYCVPLKDGDFFSRLEGLTAAVRELQPRRPLIFVPPHERVTAVVAHLRRAGGPVGARAVALHEAMGFVSDEDFGGVRGRHASEAIQKHDELVGQFKVRGANAAGGGKRASGGDGGDGGPGSEIGAAERGGSSISGGGSGDLLAGGGGGGRRRSRNGDGDGGSIEEPMDVLVTGEDSARGLHFDGVDFVFLMQKPKSPDEYVHLAGRTGRQGRTGTVVSFVDFEEFRKLMGWSKSLKVNFEPLDILNVAKR